MTQTTQERRTNVLKSIINGKWHINIAEGKQDTSININIIWYINNDPISSDNSDNKKQYYHVYSSENVAIANIMTALCN